MESRYFFTISVFLAMLSFFSCHKDNLLKADSFYGQWKTSYGDTISFSKESDKNILTYDLSMNALSPVDAKNEFTYRNNKLGIKDGFNGTNDFRILQSFSWIQEGESFTIQGIEWFNFLSSTQTYFTFTKIP